MENASNFGQKVISDKVIVSSSDDLNSSMANLKRKIDLAKGQKKVDLLVKNANIVNVFSGEIHNDNVAIADGIFVGFGHTEEYKEYDAQDIIDVQGRFMCPGLIDGHIHLESTF
jgi:adenine deaminase